MRIWAGILTAVLLGVFVPGCARSASPAPDGQSPGASKSLSASSRAITVSSETAEKYAGLKKGDSVAVNGENKDFGLHGVGFLDENTGWMIEDRYHPKGGDIFSQLLTTRNGGKSWTKIGRDDFKLDTVRFVTKAEGWAISRGKSSTDPDAATQYAVLHTTDGGAGWKTQWKSGTLPDSAPVLRFPDRQAGYALLGGKMLRTCDGGKNWVPVLFGAQDFIPSCFTFADAQNGWAAGASGKKDSFSVLQTSDGGKSWRLQLREKGDGPMGILAIDFLNAREGWFLMSDMSTMDGELYHTADGGTHWQAVGKMRCARPYPEGLCFVDSQTGWIPFNHGAGPIDGGLANTRDGGKSFQILGETDAEGGGSRAITNAQEITFLSKQTGWAVGSDPDHGDYLLRTKDGGSTWKQAYPAVYPTVDFSFPDENRGFGLGMLSDPRRAAADQGRRRELGNGKELYRAISAPKTLVPQPNGGLACGAARRNFGRFRKYAGHSAHIRRRKDLG